MTRITLRNMDVGEWEHVRDSLSVTGALLDYHVREAGLKIRVTMELDSRNPYTKAFVEGVNYSPLQEILKEYI